MRTDRQRARAAAVFATDEYVPVEVTWWISQRVIVAYAHPRNALGLRNLICECRCGAPARRTTRLGTGDLDVAQT